MVKIKRLFFILFVFIFSFSFINIGKVFAATNIIELTNISILEQTSSANGEISNYSSNNVETNNTYHAINNYIEYELTIKNIDTKPYSIKSISDNNDNPNIYYEYFKYKNKVLKPNQEVKIRIRENYSKEISNVSERVVNNNVKFFFNLVDENGVEIYTDGDNPFTGDNLVFYVAIGALSLTFLLVALYIIHVRLKKKAERLRRLEEQRLEEERQRLLAEQKPKKRKRKSKTLVILFLLAISLIPMQTKAASDIEATITFNNSTLLYSRVNVVFKYNGIEKITSVKYNSFVTEPKTPKKKGYKFLGWYCGNTKFDFTSRVTSDMDLIARYSKETYTITYNLAGGTSTNPSTYNISELPITLENPTKKGYTFIGWTGANGDTPEKDLVITEANKNLEYTANYEIKNYTITYKGLTNSEKNSLNNPNTYKMTDEVTLNNPTERKDKDGLPSQKFLGWKDDNNNVSVNISFSNSTKDKTFEAVWFDLDDTEYTITYNLNGGSVDGENPTTFTKTTETFTLINPTKRGYEFTGWTGTGLSELTKFVIVEEGTKTNLEFEAHYNKKEYTITYELDGGEVSSNPGTYTVTDEITLNNPTKRGYEFIGWTGTGLDTPTINVSIPVNSIGNRTYTANYQIKTYTITYNLYDGVVTSNPDTYKVTDTFTLNNPTREASVFTGWTWSGHDTPEENVTISNSVGNLVFTANYRAANYYIHFDKNDSAATGTMNDLEMTVGEARQLTKNAFIKTGYRFDKWTTNPDGTGTVYDDEESVLNLATTGTVNLYARWVKVKSATFAKGQDVNQKMKRIAGNSSATYTTSNTNIKKVKFSSTVPTEYQTDNNKVSDASSEYPIYMWFITDTLYYGSEADVMYLNKDSTYFYNALFNVTEIENHYNTSQVTNMSQMYYQCEKLTTNNISDFDVSHVTNMTSMFGKNKAMKHYDIQGWDVHNVSNFSFMFNENTTILSLDLRGWNTSGATNMQNMFSSMYALTELRTDTFDTSHVTNFAKMFDNERAMVSLDLRHFNTSNGTSMWKMFYNMYALQSLDLSSFDTRKVTNMQEMFIGTNTIPVLDLSSFDTSKVNNFNNMFKDMTGLTTIYVSDSFVTTGLTSTPSMFANCTSLVGGAGTAYSDSYTKSDYAHIDGGQDNPGYFTRKQ